MGVGMRVWHRDNAYYHINIGTKIMNQNLYLQLVLLWPPAPPPVFLSTPCTLRYIYRPRMHTHNAGGHAAAAPTAALLRLTQRRNIDVDDAQQSRAINARQQPDAGTEAVYGLQRQTAVLV